MLPKTSVGTVWVGIFFFQEKKIIGLFNSNKYLILIFQVENETIVVWPLIKRCRNFLSRHFCYQKKVAINNRYDVCIPTHQSSIILRWSSQKLQQCMYLVYCNWIFQSLFSHHLNQIFREYIKRIQQ